MRGEILIFGQLI